MFTVVVALMPAAISSVVVFGLGAVVRILTCAAGCLGVDALARGCLT